MGALATRNGARHPGRSVLTIGLVASATFLIVAISAFRIDPSQLGPELNSGNGGFTLVAQSSAPLLANLNDYRSGETQFDLNLSADQAQVLAEADTTVFSLPVRAGDDSSCLNLYQTGTPRVLGIPPELVERGGFAWGGSLAEQDAGRENPWLLLNPPTANDYAGPQPPEAGVVPCVLDAATAMYGLKWSLGSVHEADYGGGQLVKFWVVGLLKNSILQGDVLVGEWAFRRAFPDVSGSRFFLVSTKPEAADKVAAVLEQAGADEGLDAQRAGDRLAEFLAVQNTYLSTFQSLGGLGLLLGTLGLATVQLRGILERRGELALLRATGFRRRRLARLVMTENVLLLLGGLGIGCASALVAIAPHLLLGGAAVPWTWLGVTLGLVLATGLIAGLGAVRAALATPLLPALRGN